MMLTAGGEVQPSWGVSAMRGLPSTSQACRKFYMNVTIQGLPVELKVNR